MGLEQREGSRTSLPSEVSISFIHWVSKIGNLETGFLRFLTMKQAIFNVLDGGREVPKSTRQEFPSRKVLPTAHKND